MCTTTILVHRVSTRRSFFLLSLSHHMPRVSQETKKKKTTTRISITWFFFSFCRVVSAYNRLVLKNSGQPPPIRRLRHRFLVFRLLRRTVVCLARYSFPASSGQSSTRSCAATTTNTLCNDWCCPGSRPRLSLARPPLIAHLFILFFFRYTALPSHFTHPHHSRTRARDIVVHGAQIRATSVRTIKR